MERRHEHERDQKRAGRDQAEHAQLLRLELPEEQADVCR
jgi:hypothetical protein